MNEILHAVKNLLTVYAIYCMIVFAIGLFVLGPVIWWARRHPDGVRLWLDDVRPAPEGWLHVKTVAEAKSVLSKIQVLDLSLDHDLGEDETGYDLVKWLAETHVNWPYNKPTIHSMNPVGRDNMQATIERYGGYSDVVLAQVD